jgi:hypothetical protein
MNIPPTHYPNFRDPVLGTSCELIAISVSISEGFVSSVLRMIGTSTETGDAVYNVLWIEWVDGIAYRKAIGQVAKSAWDSHTDDWIDVVLG